MRPIEDVELVLSLVEQGLNDCEIQRRTGVPRRTVLDWRQGRVPRRPRTGRSCDRCGNPDHDFSALPDIEYAYLLGLYLGDGCLSRAARGVFRLRITLDTKYPGIVSECVRATKAVMPKNKVGTVWRRTENAVDVSSWSRSWPCLLPQHGEGKKHERRVALVAWQWRIVSDRPEALLRGLIHSDGSRSTNTIRHPNKTYVYPRYLFSNKSSDIRGIFCWACDLLGIEWRQMNAMNVSVARGSAVRLMDAFIGPKA